MFVNGIQEKYGLNWDGKHIAVQLADATANGTLMPCPEDSVDWDTTQHLMIEGDNVEALKLLQKTHASTVNFIYIDPPYNTGNRFVYSDKHGSSPGKRHSGWLSMMYPRCVLARTLLAPDGVMLVSIGNEMANLRLLLDEVFGEDNFLATIVWVANLRGRQLSKRGPVGTHEYILCYARDAKLVGQARGEIKTLQEQMPAIYKMPDYEIRQDERGPYVVKNRLHNTNSKFNEQTMPTMVFDIHHNFYTGETRTTDTSENARIPGFAVARPHPNARPGVSYHAWRWSRKRVVAESDSLEFRIDRGRLRIGTKIRDIDHAALKDIVIGPSTTSGQDDLKKLGLARVFDNPKPVSLIQVLLASMAPSDATVMDFFAGSGTTGHAVMAQNAVDGGSRRHIVVQIPETLDPSVKGHALAAEFCDNLGVPRNLAEVTKERLRRAAKDVQKNAAVGADLGFRVFRIGTGECSELNS